MDSIVTVFKEHLWTTGFLTFQDIILHHENNDTLWRDGDKIISIFYTGNHLFRAHAKLFEKEFFYLLNCAHVCA